MPFFLAAGIRGVPLKIQLVRQASSFGERGSEIRLELKLGNGPSFPDEVGNTGLSLELWRETRVSSRGLMGTSGPLEV